jgi:hypothetical protein
MATELEQLAKPARDLAAANRQELPTHAAAEAERQDQQRANEAASKVAEAAPALAGGR